MSTMMGKRGEKGTHIPLRTCRGCGARRPKGDLVRMVMGPDGLTPDATAPGRGVYCCPDDRCRQRLLKNKKVLNKALRLGNRWESRSIE